MPANIVSLDQFAETGRVEEREADKPPDYFIQKYGGDSFAYQNTGLPPMINDLMRLVDFKRDGKVDAEEFDQFVKMYQHSKHNRKANSSELDYANASESIKEVLKTWDTDESGTVSVVELLHAAQAQEKMRYQNNIMKFFLVGAIILVLVLSCATVGLVYAAALIAKDTKVDDSGIMKTVENDNAVVMGQAETQSYLEDILTIESSQMQSIDKMAVQTADGTQYVLSISDISRDNNIVTMNSATGITVTVNNQGANVVQDGQTFAIYTTDGNGRRLQGGRGGGTIIGKFQQTTGRKPNNNYGGGGGRLPPVQGDKNNSRRLLPAPSNGVERRLVWYSNVPGARLYAKWAKPSSPKWEAFVLSPGGDRLAMFKNAIEQQSPLIHSRLRHLPVTDSQELMKNPTVQYELLRDGHIDATTWAKVKRQGLKATTVSGELSPSIIAHTLSHAKAWKSIVDNGLDFGLVLEDDLRYLSKNFDAHLSFDVFQNDDQLARPHTGIIHLQHCGDGAMWPRGSPTQPPSEAFLTNVIDDYEITPCTSAYVVSKDVAYQLLHKVFPVKRPLDHAFVPAIIGDIPRMRFEPAIAQVA